MRGILGGCIVGSVLLAALPASAGTTADFNFTAGSPTCNNCTSTSGNYVFSAYNQTNPVGGPLSGTVTDTVTMSAWQVPISGSGSTGDLTGAYTGFYSGFGVGICSTTEGPGCSPPYHQIDNADGDYELMEFQFATPVDITQITLANFGTADSTVDLSSTIFSSSASINLASTTLSTLESGDHEQNFDCTSATTGSGAGCQTSSTNVTYTDPFNSAYGADAPTATDNVNLNDITTLIIASQIGQTDDFFKVQSIMATIASTPEPGTFGMLVPALVGLGLFLRKRSSQS